MTKPSLPHRRLRRRRHRPVRRRDQGGIWDSPASASGPALTFTADGRLDRINGTPVASASPSNPMALYGLFFLNQKASPPTLQTVLARYDYTPGLTGNSKAWFYDTVTGTWTLKPNPAGDFFDPPYYFHAVGDYVLVADAPDDPAKESGGSTGDAEQD